MGASLYSDTLYSYDPLFRYPMIRCSLGPMTYVPKTSVCPTAQRIYVPLVRKPEAPIPEKRAQSLLPVTPTARLSDTAICVLYSYTVGPAVLYIYGLLNGWTN